MTKIVINDDYGGYSLTNAAIEYLKKLGKTGEIARDDPDLIKLIEKNGIKLVGSSLSHLKIVEIPDDVEWMIEDYDGWETIHEVHRSWG